MITLKRIGLVLLIVLIFSAMVVFTAGNQAGRVAQRISLHTDHGDVVQAFTAFAEVVKPDAPAAPRSPSSGKQKPAASSKR